MASFTMANGMSGEILVAVGAGAMLVALLCLTLEVRRNLRRIRYLEHSVAELHQVEQIMTRALGEPPPVPWQPPDGARQRKHLWVLGISAAAMAVRQRPVLSMAAIVGIALLTLGILVLEPGNGEGERVMPAEARPDVVPRQPIPPTTVPPRPPAGGGADQEVTGASPPRAPAPGSGGGGVPSSSSPSSPPAAPPVTSPPTTVPPPTTTEPPPLSPPTDIVTPPDEDTTGPPPRQATSCRLVRAEVLGLVEICL